LNFHVAANFSLRVFFVFKALQTQANPESIRGCGYQNWTFARASLAWENREEEKSPSAQSRKRVILRDEDTDRGTRISKKKRIKIRNRNILPVL
jgi:hypothetical protein